MTLETASFAAVIRASRAVLGWSQSTLAQKAGIATVSIARIESGSINPRINTARNLIRTFQDAGLEILQDEPRGGFTLIASEAVFEAEI
jgi:DNA-binding XRE family transcriptional regulator